MHILNAPPSVGELAPVAAGAEGDAEHAEHSGHGGEAHQRGVGDGAGLPPPKERVTALSAGRNPRSVGSEPRTRATGVGKERDVSRPWRSENGKIGGVLLLVLVVGGLILLGATFAGRGRESNDEPTCDGERMSPGDVCFSYGNPDLGGTYEEMKERVPGNRRGNRIASIVSFSLAGLALVGGLLNWRNGRRDAAARSAALGDNTMMEMVMALAARDELGALLDSTREDTAFRRGRGERMHHRFEQGLVADTERGPVSFPYRDVRIYREHSPHLSRSNNLVTSWRFERSDGQVWQTTQSNNAPLGRVYEQVLAAACAQQREAAVHRLAEGATLAFGPVELDRSQMTFGAQGSGVRDTVAWTAVTRLSIEKGPIMMVETARDGRLLKKLLRRVASVGEVPNFPMLWELANLAHANAGRTAESS